MKWSDTYTIGVERIDDQHKMIFKMSEDFRAALDEGRGERVYGGLLQSLSIYVRAHFGFEERCMDAHRCPVAQRNKEAHAAFLDVLSDYRQRFAAKGYGCTDASHLADTLDEWLAEHICRIDIHLKECIRKS